MKLRVLLRASLATITVVAAGACVVSGNLWIAGGLVVCAVAVAALPLASRVSHDDVKALLESLRIAQQAGKAAVTAVVTPKIIFIARSAISDAPASSYALLFRDEMDASVWRELATLLRHQSHLSPQLKKVDQGSAYRLGKSSHL